MALVSLDYRHLSECEIDFGSAAPTACGRLDPSHSGQPAILDCIKWP
jgi:hypothetical protein